MGTSYLGLGDAIFQSRTDDRKAGVSLCSLVLLKGL